ncbi:MAG: ketoacyl-ACP synthase III [Bacilli bacterium]
MAMIKFDGVGISAIAACVPKDKIINLEATEYFPPDSVAAVVDKIGVFERRQADASTCASDLAVAAAEKLFADNSINPDDVDALIFVSQTPDYRMPATAFPIQHRLGISKKVIAFDVNLGCSGFLHGLYLAYSLLQNEAIENVLLLNGETRTKVYSKKDRRVAFLFGDAASATLVNKSGNYGLSYFSIGSDGENSHMVMIPGGGYRNPSSVETLKERVVDENGNIRTDEQGYMMGEDVLGLFMRVMPKDIKSLIEFSGMDKDIIDFFVIHEGSKYLSSFIKKRLKLPEEKTPSILSKFGNTSSVSIPLNIVSELRGKLEGNKELLMTVLGVGMTWASAIIQADNLNVSELVEL